MQTHMHTKIWRVWCKKLCINEYYMHDISETCARLSVSDVGDSSLASKTQSVLLRYLYTWSDEKRHTIWQRLQPTSSGSDRTDSKHRRKKKSTIHTCWMWLSVDIDMLLFVAFNFDYFNRVCGFFSSFVFCVHTGKWIPINYGLMQRDNYVTIQTISDWNLLCDL